MRTGGTRVGNRCYIQAGTQISPSSRVARRLCCEDPGTCLYREACSHYTEPVPVAARGGELGAPGSCADHRTCSHVRNCRYEDEGVSMGRARERAGSACDVVWVLKGSDARRHPRPPPRRRRRPRIPARRPRPQTVPRHGWRFFFPGRALKTVYEADTMAEFIAENGGRHELRLEPSVARPQIYSCIGSRHWAGMVLEKRAVQIAID